MSSRIIHSAALLSVFLLAASVVSSSRLAAQTRRSAAKKTPPTALKLVSIKVSGSKRYTEQDMVRATGLQLGQIVNDEDFKRASERLGEMGAFSNVAYTYDYSGQEAKLALQVSDADQFVPARFENFVWLSDQELQSRLHGLTPLFDGQLPLSGTLSDQISEDLQAFLSQNNLPGHVNYLRAGVENGPVEAIVFSVADVDIRIRQISFTGAGPAEQPALQAASERLEGEEFSASEVHVQVEKNLLPIYRSRGYLKATIAEVQAKVAHADANQTDVDITFAVDPGRQYQLKEIQLSGMKVIAQDKLREMIHLQAGIPPDAVRLQTDIDAITKLYSTHGYMAVSVQSTPTFDDAAATMSYRILVQEGDQYHMGELDIRGLDSRATDRLQLKWKLHPGDPYDSSYLSQFLEEAKGMVPEDWTISVHETPDAKDKTVDVTLRFDRKS